MEEFALYNPKSLIGKRLSKHRSSQTRTSRDIKSSQKISPGLPRTSSSTNKCTHANQEMENITGKSRNTEIVKIAEISPDDKLFNVGSKSSKMNQTTLSDWTRTSHDTESSTHRISRIKIEKGISPDTERTPHNTESSTHRSFRIKIDKGTPPETARASHGSKSSKARYFKSSKDRSSNSTMEKTTFHGTKSGNDRSVISKMDKALPYYDVQSVNNRSGNYKMEKKSQPDIPRSSSNIKSIKHNFTIDNTKLPDMAETSKSTNRRSDSPKMEDLTLKNPRSSPCATPDNHGSRIIRLKDSKTSTSHLRVPLFSQQIQPTHRGSAHIPIPLMSLTTRPPTGPSSKSPGILETNAGTVSGSCLNQTHTGSQSSRSVIRSVTQPKSLSAEPVCSLRPGPNAESLPVVPGLKPGKSRGCDNDAPNALGSLVVTGKGHPGLKYARPGCIESVSAPSAPKKFRSQSPAPSVRFSRELTASSVVSAHSPYFVPNGHRSKLAPSLVRMVGPCEPVSGNAVNTKPRNQRLNKASLCPVPGCGYKSNSLKLHVLTLHLPSFFRVPRGRLACPCPGVISKRVLALRSVARAIPGVGENLWTLLNRVNSDHLVPLDSRVNPETYIAYEELARQLGWVPITNFSLNPLTHPALLTHWRVFASILGYVSQTERHALLDRFF
ncbi:hypothetical protein SNE40_017568 [Patella caerulea]|uniref:Uncharacterized protein n=1 Tax=Patella caerulea TaxID=87958 RepID=A0AAN8JAN6_PATCE